MKNNTLLIGLGLSSLLLAACATTPTSTTAIKNENNQYQITGIGKTALIAKNNAINAANKTCGRSTPIVISENTQYQGALKGIVDEETGKLVEATANAIGTIIGKNTSIAKDDDYQTALVFTCRNN